MYPLRKNLVIRDVWIGISVMLLMACHTVPVTGRSQMIFIDEPQEIALGLASYKDALSKSKLSKNQTETQRVRRVGQRIATVVDRSDYDWEFNLIDDDRTINAFALPGGKVAVYTGLLSIAKGDAALATVLSHEIAHAMARHGGERMTTGLLAEMGRAILDASLAAGVKDPNMIKAYQSAYGIGAQLGVLLPFNRKQESEADHIGLILMARAGYDPAEASQFWRRMAALDQQKPPEWLSTHPSDETRIRQLEEWLPEAKSDYLATRSDSSSH